jgi:hypothetical protein
MQKKKQSGKELASEYADCAAGVLVGKQDPNADRQQRDDQKQMTSGKAVASFPIAKAAKRIGKRRRGWQGGGLCLLSTRLAERRSEQPVSSREASDNARRPASGARGAGPRGGRAIESLRGAERS